MIVHPRAVPESVDEAIAGRVAKDVTNTLQAITTDGGRFVVNDTPWFQVRPRGNVTPCVMNTAGFISSRFQNSLRDECGWEKEKTLRDQVIDNYIELSTVGPAYCIPSESFVDFFQAHVRANRPDDLRHEFLGCWHKYVQTGISSLDEVEGDFREFFSRTDENTRRVLRIGLEFETGNIASAFRALDKLETLFVLGEIDYGIFVTSIDKSSAAARIWPASNRNGSFQELEKRNYKNNRTVPLWEFGFEPDEFRRDAPYLGSSQNLYVPVPTGKTETHRGVEYDVFLRYENEVILRPKGVAPS